MSATCQGFPVIGDDFQHLPEHGRGYEARNYLEYPLAGLKCATQATRKTIDPKEIPDRINQKKGQWVSDLCDAAGSPVKGQDDTNFCFANAPCRGMEVCNVLAGGPKLVFSAAQPACQITHGRNVGGSGIQVVEHISQHGVCTEDFWARNLVSGRAPTPEATANAALHKIVDWEEHDCGDQEALWLHLITSVLLDIPVTVGIPRWSHEVLLTFLVWDPSKFSRCYGGVGFGADNSWKPTWGVNGRCVLSLAYSIFDEAGSVLNVTPSMT